jgi:hypothetical protein
MIWNPTKDYAGANEPTRTLVGLKKVICLSNNQDDEHA